MPLARLRPVVLAAAVIACSDGSAPAPLGAGGGSGSAGGAAGAKAGASGSGGSSAGASGSPVDAAAADGAMPTVDAATPENVDAGPAANALLVPGGYDRLVIAKRDDARALCFRVTLASPQYAGALDVTVPKSWVAESVSASSLVGGCRGLPAGADGLVLARSATGQVSWAGQRPCRVSLDVDATFAATAVVHQRERIVVADVPVDGCP